MEPLGLSVLDFCLLQKLLAGGDCDEVSCDDAASIVGRPVRVGGQAGNELMISPTDRTRLRCADSV